VTTTALATQDAAQLTAVLRNSLYPGASDASIGMVIAYCKQTGLDPMQKPVHIVPMWDGKAKQMRDVIMPGVGLYRTQAARTGQCAGITEPEFGPDKTMTLGGAQVTFPEWCKVTVKRRLSNGAVADFTAIERWLENYAQKGGQEKSIAPNAMWMKRPYGQLAKCAEAQALRKAFPEFAAAMTAEEMEGKTLDPETPPPPADPWTPQLKAAAQAAAEDGLKSYNDWWKLQSREFRAAATTTKQHEDYKAQAAREDEGKAGAIDVQSKEVGSDPAN
jgi:phage recombination protein Bet